jgi:hypothetical protein
MDPGSKQKWIELLGAAGVVASLIFVGLEVRQNTAAVRGATYQAIADSSLQQVQWWASNEALLQHEVRIDAGALPADFSAEENLVIRASIVMTIRRIENVFVQVREGLVEKDAVLRFRPSNDYFQSLYFREFWASWRLETEPKFREFFEREFLSDATVAAPNARKDRATAVAANVNNKTELTAPAGASDPDMPSEQAAAADADYPDETPVAKGQTSTPAAEPAIDVVAIPVSDAHAKLLGGTDRRNSKHAELEAEPEDDNWSYFMEQSLSMFLSQHPNAGLFTVFSVECRSTLCQIQVIGFDESTSPDWGRVLFDLSKQPWYDFNQVHSTSDEYQGQLAIATHLKRASVGN